MDVLDLLEVKEEMLCYNEQDPSLEAIGTRKEEKNTDLQVSPTVHTTRLDDMNLFKKDLSYLSSDSFINQVITESKPKVLKCTQNIRSVRISKRKNKFSSSNFNRLLCKLKQYNENISRTCDNSSEVNEKSILVKLELRDEAKYHESNGNQPLIGLCKPLSVTLNNCDSILNYCYCSMHKINSSHNEIMRCRSCVKWYKINKNKVKLKCKRRIDSLQATPEYISYTAPAKEIFIKLKDINKQLDIANVVMKNIYLNSTEICYISLDSKTMTDYHYVNHIITTVDELTIYVNVRSIIELFNCCWYKRRDNISKLLPDSDLSFLTNRLSHSCPYFHCICCCKVSQHEMVSSSFNDQTSNAESDRKNVIINIRNKTKSVWRELMSNTNNETSLINKALKYSEKRKPKPRKLARKDMNSLPCFVLHIKSNPKLSKSEHCVIREDGQVQNYIVHWPRKTEQITKYINTLKNSNMQNFKLKACCWISHDEILTQLPVAAAQFLKKAHFSRVGKCNSCYRKYIEILNVQVRKIDQNFSHTKKNTTSLGHVFKNINTLLTSTIEQCQLPILQLKATNQIHNIDNSVVNASQAVPNLLPLPFYTFILPPSIPLIPVIQQNPIPISATNVVNPYPLFPSNSVFLAQPYNVNGINTISKVEVGGKSNYAIHASCAVNNTPTNLLLLQNQEWTQSLQSYPNNAGKTNLTPFIPSIQPLNIVAMPLINNAYSLNQDNTFKIINGATHIDLTKTEQPAVNRIDQNRSSFRHDVPSSSNNLMYKL